MIWLAVVAAVAVPMAIAATSPQLVWRHPIYIAAGFAGVAGLSLLLFQPLLVGGYLPLRSGRRAHRWVGGALVLLVLAHVGGLWITNAPDVIDALLFESPTPFSVWGVIAMWAVLIAGLSALLRNRLNISRRMWRVAHTMLATTIVVCTVAHAWLIEGTMGDVSKAVLCAFVLIATVKVIFDLRAWSTLRQRS